jgi:hypothetical protein
VAAVPDIRKLNINGMFSLVLAGGESGTGIPTFGIGERLSELAWVSGLGIMIGVSFFRNYRLIGNKNESDPRIFLVKITWNPKNILSGILFRGCPFNF